MYGPWGFLSFSFCVAPLFGKEVATCMKILLGRVGDFGGSLIFASFRLFGKCKL